LVFGLVFVKVVLVLESCLSLFLSCSERRTSFRKRRRCTSTPINSWTLNRWALNSWALNSWALNSWALNSWALNSCICCRVLLRWSKNTVSSVSFRNGFDRRSFCMSDVDYVLSCFILITTNARHSQDKHSTTPTLTLTPRP
jgi:hypothetical protein